MQAAANETLANNELTSTLLPYGATVGGIAEASSCVFRSIVTAILALGGSSVGTEARLEESDSAGKDDGVVVLEAIANGKVVLHLLAVLRFVDR
jgi:hypothetical protein